MIVLLRGLWILLFLTSSLVAQDIEHKDEFYVSSISWHTAIVIPASAFPHSLWTSKHDFSGGRFLEIGWGDVGYFTDKSFNIRHAFKSMFWPTVSFYYMLILSTGL